MYVIPDNNLGQNSIHTSGFLVITTVLNGALKMSIV